jgi:hypothetical protein
MASTEVIAEIGGELGAHIETASGQRFWNIDQLLRELLVSGASSVDVEALIACKFSPRVYVLLLNRGGEELRASIWREVLATYQGDDESVRSPQATVALELAFASSLSWDAALKCVRENYACGAVASMGEFSARRVRAAEIPTEVATEILAKPHHYPLHLTWMAEESVGGRRAPRPVAELVGQ